MCAKRIGRPATARPIVTPIGRQDSDAARRKVSCERRKASHRVANQSRMLDLPVELLLYSPAAHAAATGKRARRIRERGRRVSQGEGERERARLLAESGRAAGVWGHNQTCRWHPLCNHHRRLAPLASAPAHPAPPASTKAWLLSLADAFARRDGSWPAEKRRRRLHGVTRSTPFRRLLLGRSLPGRGVCLLLSVVASEEDVVGDGRVVVMDICGPRAGSSLVERAPLRS